MALKLYTVNEKKGYKMHLDLFMSSIQAIALIFTGVILYLEFFVEDKDF